MKRFILITSLFLMGAGSLFSQKGESRIGLSGTFGLTPFDAAAAWGGTVHFTYPVSRILYISASGGWMAGDHEVRISNAYYYSTERIGHLGLSLGLDLTPNSDRNTLGLGMGTSFLLVDYEYIAEISTQEPEFSDRIFFQPQINLFLENQFALTDRWSVFGRCTVRSSFIEVHSLERYFQEGSPQVIGGMRNNLSLDLGVMYSF